MLFQRWRAVQPVPVSVTTPVVRSVTETIAVTGRVAGYRETLVGSQNAGILRELRVQAGDRIRKGGLLAKMESAVALTHLALAQKTLTTVRARRTEIARGPRTSEVDAARARVAQAVASSAEALAAVDEALPTLPQAQAAVAQMQARRDLASRDQTRQIALYRDGATAAVEVEKATVAFEAAAADLTVARQKVLVARASIGAARSRAAAAAALARAVRADRRTLEAGPKPETVAVADRQVREAVEAIRVARAQVRTSDVLAPFAGTITAILAQVGTSVGPGGGIVKLVQTGNPEIRMDVDESNLPQLRVGERVVVTSAAYRNDAFEATVSRIGAQVDDARGTVEVVAAAPQAPLWIRPGQTLNVNIVTGEAVRRLFIPTVALRSDGDRHYVIDAAGGRARWQMVLPGEVAGNQVTVLEGLRGGEQIVTDPKIPFTAGAALKIRRESASGSGNRKSETR
jgi:HlyD family secretion protein